MSLNDPSGALVDTSGELGDQGELNYVWTRAGSGWEYQMLGTLEPTPAPSEIATAHSWGPGMDAMCSTTIDEAVDPDLDTSQYPVLCASVVTHDGFEIDDSPKVPATFVIGAAGVVLHSGVIGIEIRGQSSQNRPKKQ